jgi:FAD/FMN-containing dehydrogenase
VRWRIVIDLSPMKGVWVDPAARTARAQPGLLWGEFDRETQAFGLATARRYRDPHRPRGPHARRGLGWLMRRHGLTIDNLLSAEVVTADGEVARASADEHADLFWGLRGGGGNFGVVTSFEYRLHPVGPIVLAGVMLYPAARAREVLGFYRDCIASAPDELTTIVVLTMAPPAPFLPPSVHGQPVVIIGACYAGPIDEGNERSRRCVGSASRWPTRSGRRHTCSTRRCSTPACRMASGTTGSRSTWPR